MDKVIIDGVDVSECMYFRMNNKMPMCKACNSGVGSPYCEYHKDCYYRQLKRLQAENERLKEENEKLNNQYCFSTILKIDELKAENEKLKSVLDYDEKLLIKYVKTLLDIKDCCNDEINAAVTNDNLCRYYEILDKINEVIGAEQIG